MAQHNPKFESRVRAEWPDKADAILAVIRGNRAHAITYPSAHARDKQSYHPHNTATIKLEALNDILDGFGVEGVQAGRGAKSPAFDYVNMGDTYAPTIVLVLARDGSAVVWRVSSWGDIVEQGDYD